MYYCEMHGDCDLEIYYCEIHGDCDLELINLVIWTSCESCVHPTNLDVMG
jgi:hypothetical protein